MALPNRVDLYSASRYFCYVIVAPQFRSWSDFWYRFVLPDYPHSTTWLTPEERSIAVMRLQSASGMKDGARGNLLAGLKMALYDYKVWLLAFVCHCHRSAAAHSLQANHHYQND